MIYELYQQEQAEVDLKEIWIYSYKEYGEIQADKYYVELSIGMEAIKASPYIGMACDPIRVHGKRIPRPHNF